MPLVTLLDLEKVNQMMNQQQQNHINNFNDLVPAATSPKHVPAAHPGQQHPRQPTDAQNQQPLRQRPTPTNPVTEQAF